MWDSSGGSGRDREWPLLVTSETGPLESDFRLCLFHIAQPVAWEILHFDLTEKGRFDVSNAFCA